MKKANRLLEKINFFNSELTLAMPKQYVFDNDDYRIVIRIDNKRYRIEVHDKKTKFNKYYNYLIQYSPDLTMYLKSLTL